MNYLELLKLAAPEAILVLAALAVLSANILWTRRGSDSRTLCAAISAIGVLGSMGSLATLPEKANLLGGMLVVSPLVVLFKFLCLALALATICLARSTGFGKHTGEFYALILFATVGLLLLVGSEELLMIFVGLEVAGLSLYVMAGFDKTDPRSAEAGLKYFLYGSMASAFTLYGLSLIYGVTGTTSLASVAKQLAQGTPVPLLAAGVVMTVVGLGFKIAAAPFHLWAADTYQGAPLPAAAFIASGSKVATFVVLGKLLIAGFAPLATQWSNLIVLLAALSILIGNFAALAQTNVRRLLAYSAVAHAGYALMGLIGGLGFAATLFYAATYGFTALGAFGVIACVRRETGGDDITHLAGLRARSPLLAICLAIFFLSLAGLPPLAGFFGKFYLFASVLGNPNTLWLVAVALVGSLISLYYYVVVLKRALVDTGSAAPMRVQPLEGLTLLLLAVLVLGLGLCPESLLGRILSALGQGL